MSENTETIVPVETPRVNPVVKVRNFVQKHKTPIIAGSIATVGLVLLAKVRSSRQEEATDYDVYEDAEDLTENAPFDE